MIRLTETATQSITIKVLTSHSCLKIFTGGLIFDDKILFCIFTFLPPPESDILDPMSENMTSYCCVVL